jgi:hypothetical protein
MIREKVTYKDYFKIARENEYFLWHFLQKDQNEGSLVLSTIIDEKTEHNPLPNIMDNLDIPYFESYTEDSLDFLVGLGFDMDKLYRNVKGLEHKRKFAAIIIGFNKFTKVSSTFQHCYCPEGVVSVLNDLHPKFIEQLNNNL